MVAGLGPHRLVMIVELPMVDPSLFDPDEAAEDILDEDHHVKLISAEWAEP